MSKNNLIKFDPAIPARFSDWFGAPAVLTAEDLQIHDRILCGLFHDVRPKDFFECMFIDDLAYLVGRRLALRRRRASRIRLANNQKFERLEAELVLSAERRKQELRNELALNKVLEPGRAYLNARARQPHTKLAVEQEMMEAETNEKLAQIDAETNKRLAELQKAKDGPIDEAASFDQWIDDVERINEEEAVVEQQIRMTLKLLEAHRTGLGQRLHEVADEIVDVEFAEEQAPAREDDVASTESASGTEVGKTATRAMKVLSLTELPSPASSQTNGGAAILSDGRPEIPAPEH